VSAHVVETGQVFLEARVMPLTMPKVNLLCGKQVKVGQKLRCDLSFANPLGVPLEAVRVRATGDASVVAMEPGEVAAVERDGVVSATVEGRAIGQGAGVISVAVEARGIGLFYGSEGVRVQRAR
jgi:hypothetical protein